ncbi:MAG: exodeoxyribonuclease VII large subunit [Anaerolineales bacterium]|nr:exodeoxyribonuclease VII large subunit [Anaerolineae bacterium]MCB9142303.1 exodeoxyribonuclease VII large subunit [Anaerolineales bacterium]
MITVSQLITTVKNLLEVDSDLTDVWVEGEVSNFKQAASGHCYFTLKDSRAVVPCVMWRNDALRLRRLPVDGEQVAIHGYISLYEPQGKLQFYADRLDLAGLGKLYQEFERLKAQLAAEGLFDAARKQPLPAWPARIGVVTSSKAAALRDILRTLAVRYPLVDVLLAPTAVQGAEAPAQIAAAIDLLNAWNLGVEPIDVLIVARGGGSIEELWAFNDEQVVRAIAASVIPVISGVGHETDFTLSDLAADQRAPTPTGAAALAVPDRLELAGQLPGLRSRLQSAAAGHIDRERRQLVQTRRLLERLSPAVQLATRRQQVDELSRSMTRTAAHRLAVQRAQVDGMRARLASLDPNAVLARGYAILQEPVSGAVITSVAQAASGMAIRARVADGEFDVTVS